MTWNYRIIYHVPARKEDVEGSFAIHEVYYNSKGKPNSYTGPITFQCDEYEGPDGIRKSLAMALADAVRLPVLMIQDGKLVERK